jgi:hypothetical protein
MRIGGRCKAASNAVQRAMELYVTGDTVLLIFARLLPEAEFNAVRFD